MNGNLVDTNVIIKMLNGDPGAVQIFDSLEHVHISVITAGELFYGANKSSQKNENLELFKEFLQEYPLLGIDENTSQIYGELKAGLVKTGLNIPENDLWIAATAFQHNLTIISFDSHFKKLMF